jgi:hypothetical protein
VGQSSLGTADGPMGRLIALLGLHGRVARTCVGHILEEPAIDLVEAMAGIPRSHDPISRDHAGEHRRGLMAMAAIRERQNTEFPISHSWYRDDDEFCLDSCCHNRHQPVRQAFFLGCSAPNGGTERDAERHVGVVGYISMEPAFCSNDVLLITTTDKNGDGQSTFTLFGRKDGDRPSGLRVNAHPKLYTAAYNLKRFLVGELAFK